MLIKRGATAVSLSTTIYEIITSIFPDLGSLCHSSLLRGTRQSGGGKTRAHKKSSQGAPDRGLCQLRLFQGSEKILDGRVSVTGPIANSEATIYGVAHLDDWLGDTKWNLIHFNWGLGTSTDGNMRKKSDWSPWSLDCRRPERS